MSFKPNAVGAASGAIAATVTAVGVYANQSKRATAAEQEAGLTAGSTGRGGAALKAVGAGLVAGGTVYVGASTIQSVAAEMSHGANLKQAAKSVFSAEGMKQTLGRGGVERLATDAGGRHVLKAGRSQKPAKAALKAREPVTGKHGRASTGHSAEFATLEDGKTLKMDEKHRGKVRHAAIEGSGAEKLDARIKAESKKTDTPLFNQLKDEGRAQKSAARKTRKRPLTASPGSSGPRSPSTNKKGPGLDRLQVDAGG